MNAAKTKYGVESTDKAGWQTHNGESWQRLVSGPDVHVPRPVIEMSDGRILWTGSATDARGDSFRATFLHSESDAGIEFDRREHPELGPTSDEWYVVETRNAGELVCMMRQQQHSQYFATAKSHDYGQTWTPWRESNVLATTIEFT